MNQEQETPQEPRRSRRRMRRYSIVQRRDFYVVDNLDGQVMETDFKTRAEARKHFAGLFNNNPLLVPKESR